jgi:hypothetical protein
VAPGDVASTSAVLLPAAAHGSAAGWNSTKAFITERSGVSVECRSWGYRGRTPACICYVCNGCGDSCDIRVVTPDLGDADDEPSFLVGESDADSPDSGGCVSPALSLPSWRAAPCGSVPIVFREKKASCDVSAPSGPCSGSPLWPGAWPPSPPAARAFIPVACGEGALVAAVHQANGTLAADTLVSF